MARPTTIFHRFTQDDEKVVAASPICIDDGENSWWAGVQRCFVGVAIAGAASALATTTTVIGPFEFNDDRPTPASALQVDDGYWQQPLVQTPPPFLRVWAEDAEDERIPPATFRPNDDDAPQLAAYPGATTFIVWASDEEVVPQAAPVPFEAEWQPLLARPVLPVLQVWQDAEDFKPVTQADDEWQSPLPYFAVPIAQVWEEEDSIAQQPAALAAEDYWHRVYSIPAEPIVRLWLQQDEITTAVAPLQVDEVYWQQPAIRLQLPAQPATTADDEIVPQAVLDEDQWQRPFSVQVEPTARVWSQQDEITTPATPLPVDESYWHQWATWMRVAPIAAVWIQQDETPTVTVDTYTHDSRTRVGGGTDRVRKPRIGGVTGWSAQRIGGKRQ